MNPNYKGIPCVKDLNVPLVDREGRRVLAWRVGEPSGRAVKILIHPDRWDEFLSKKGISFDVETGAGVGVD